MSNIKNEEVEEVKNVGMLIIRENGIIRIGNFEELDKKEWIYKQVDKSEKITFVDFDVNSVKPIVKSILNEVAQFPEMIMLQQIRLLGLISIVVLTVIFYLGYTTFKQNDAIAMLKPISEGILRLETQKKVIIPTGTGSNTNF